MVARSLSSDRLLGSTGDIIQVVRVPNSSIDQKAHLSNGPTSEPGLTFRNATDMFETLFYGARRARCPPWGSLLEIHNLPGVRLNQSIGEADVLGLLYIERQLDENYGPYRGPAHCYIHVSF
jgi:hypothetical protein